MNESNKWNQLHLQAPPDRTWFTNKPNFEIKKFISALNKIKNDFGSLRMLHVEAAILSRLIYRMKSKFRSDRGLKMMSKVNRALLNYLNVNFEKIMSNFKDCVEVKDSLVTLPSRQMLEFVLIRMQGFVKLMCRAEQVAMYAAHLLKSRISLGHAWTVAKIAYAVISRIWVLLRHVIRKSCKWYNNLYEYLNKLKVVGASWLPENYNFPTDFKSWLDLPWIEEPLPVIPTQETILQSVLNMVKIESNECDESFIFEVESSEESNSAEETKVEKKQEDTNVIIDFGTKIDRDSFNCVGDVKEITEKVKEEKKRKLGESSATNFKKSKKKNVKKKKINQTQSYS